MVTVEQSAPEVSASRGRSVVIRKLSHRETQSHQHRSYGGKPTALRGLSGDRAFLQLEKQLRGYPLGCETSGQRGCFWTSPMAGSGPLCLLWPQTSCHLPPHAPQWHVCPPESLPSSGPPGVLRAGLPNCHGQPWPCGVRLGPGTPLDIPGHEATVTGPSTNETVP